MRDLTSNELYAALYLCSARHDSPPNETCDACRADIIRLVDAPPSERVPEGTVVLRLPEDAEGVAIEYERRGDTFATYYCGDGARVYGGPTSRSEARCVEYCAALNRRNG